MDYNPDVAIIREIFDGAHELFESELERAFDHGCETIVIEPCRLGEETARWIVIGDYLRRISILTGVSSIVTGLFSSSFSSTLHYSLLTTSLSFSGLHTLSWQSDICSSYRVEPNPEAVLSRIQNRSESGDNVSLVTSTEGYNMFTATGEKGNDRPKPRLVILTRMQDSDVRRSNLIKAAVGLLAIAVSMFKMFRSTIGLPSSSNFLRFSSVF